MISNICQKLDYYNEPRHNSYDTKESQLISCNLRCSHGYRLIFDVFVNKDFWHKLGMISLLSFLLIIGCSLACRAQIVPERYGSNPVHVHWRQIQTAHFVVVFPTREHAMASYLARQSEAIFREYRQKLGTAPSRKISIYYNKGDQLVSDTKARHTDSKYSIWLGKPSILTDSFYARNLKTKLRREIAYAFQENVKYFPIDYYFYLFSRPSKLPWSKGLVSYLATPVRQTIDLRVERQYGYLKQHHTNIIPSYSDDVNRLLGRSQLQDFTSKFSTDSLQVMYGSRRYILGIPYFDFNPAFKKAAGMDYDTFTNQWKRNLPHISLQDTQKRVSFKKSIIYKNNPARVLNYVGGAADISDSLIAVIKLPNSGTFAEQLRLMNWKNKSEKRNSKLIAKGHFSPQVDWSAKQGKLAFARRRYNNEKGTYYYKLQLWDASNGQIKSLSNGYNAEFPTFSGDGSQLAYVEHKQKKNEIILQNLKTGARQTAYSFKRSQTITHLDFQRKGTQLLVSYRQDGAYKAGLLNMKTHHLITFESNEKVPLQAMWGGNGQSIYFTKSFNGVSNLFEAHIVGRKLTDVRRITNQPLGIHLWDVAGKSQNQLSLLAAKEEADFSKRVFLYRLRNDTVLNNINYNELNVSTSMPLAYGQRSTKDFSVDSPDIQKYHPAGNIRWEQPFGVPYIYGGDYGLAGYVSLQEPLRTHKFNYYGTLSFNDPLHKSFFYSQYVNNMFRPRLALSFNHFPAASGFFGPSRRQAKTVNALALSSLWKINKWSHGYSKWYAGLMLRYLAFDYFSAATLHKHHQTIFYRNTHTRQTDLRASLAWRSLEPGRNTLIHPLDGDGVRFSITGSDKILGSQSRYARFNLDAYTILPGIGQDRIYLYGNGVIDVGTPAGRDYLNFSQNGDYELPDPEFMGKVNPGIDRFVRGYSNPLLGDRFLFGRLEYRIPFEFNTNQKLLGFIPPARTSFTFFTDGGVMGNARTAPHVQQTKFRYSIGGEIKRVFSFGGNFQFTYELGLAQPLTKSFGPAPFFNVKAALPF